MQQKEAHIKGGEKEFSQDGNYDVCIIHSGSDIESLLEHFIREIIKKLHLSCGPMVYNRGNVDFTVINDNLKTIFRSSKAVLLFSSRSQKDARCRFERLYALHLNVGRNGYRPTIIPVAIGKSDIPTKYQVFQELVVDTSNNWGEKLLKALAEGHPSALCRISEELARAGMEEINSKAGLIEKNEECDEFNEMETDFDTACFQMIDQFLASDGNQSYSSERFEKIKELESELCKALASSSMRDRMEFIKLERSGGISWYIGQMGLNNIHKILMLGCGMRVVNNTIVLKWKYFQQNLMCSTLTLADIVSFGRFIGITRIAMQLDTTSYHAIEKRAGENWQEQFRKFSEQILSCRFYNYDKEHLTYRVVINGIAGMNTKKIMNRCGRELHSQEFHQKNQEFQDINARLRTFRDWPYPSGVTIYDVASAGFIYTGHEDTIHCFSCNQSIYGLDQGYKKTESNFKNGVSYSCELLGDHLVWNPDCRYIQSLPFYKIMKSVLSGKSENTDFPKKEKKRDLSKLSHRLGTFDKRLPKLRCLEFAEAGFYQFFGGGGRKTIDIGCFHCNVQIQSVRLSQDPWMEHVRWSPNCKFVENKKGSAFIRDARKIFELEGEGQDDVHTEIIIETFLLQHNQMDEKDGPMPLDKENMIEEDLD